MDYLPFKQDYKIATSSRTCFNVTVIYNEIRSYPLSRWFSIALTEVYATPMVTVHSQPAIIYIQDTDSMYIMMMMIVIMVMVKVIIMMMMIIIIMK